MNVKISKTIKYLKIMLKKKKILNFKENIAISKTYQIQKMN